MQGGNILFSIKRVVIIFTFLSLIMGYGIFNKKIKEKRNFEKLVESINLNDLEGTFIVINDYEKKIFKINPEEFNEELTAYLDSINPNLKYWYSIKEEDQKYIIDITFKHNSYVKNKTFTLYFA